MSRPASTYLHPRVFAEIDAARAARLSGAAPVPRRICSRAAIGPHGIAIGKTDRRRSSGRHRRGATRSSAAGSRRELRLRSASRASASTRPARSTADRAILDARGRSACAPAPRRRRQRRRAAARGRRADGDLRHVPGPGGARRRCAAGSAPACASINSAAGDQQRTPHARMLAAFEHAPRATTGELALISTDGSDALPEWIDGGAWLKRGDVHATEPDDVVLVVDGQRGRTHRARRHATAAHRRRARATPRRRRRFQVLRRARPLLRGFSAARWACRPLIAATEHRACASSRKPARRRSS